jgi:hypothetical protein
MAADTAKGLNSLRNNMKENQINKVLPGGHWS